MCSTKEEIILSFLRLNAENGSCSLSEIASCVNIRKATIFSHFASSSALEKEALEYALELLKNRRIDVNFKAPDALTLLTDLIHGFADVFATDPVCWYYRIVLRNRYISELCAEHFRKIDMMISSRVQVALEYCIQENWLNIKNTDYASMFLASAIKEKLPVCETDWMYDEIPNRFNSLFSL